MGLKSKGRSTLKRCLSSLLFVTGRFINRSGPSHSLSLTLVPMAGWCFHTGSSHILDETVHGAGQGNHCRGVKFTLKQPDRTHSSLLT